MAMAGFGRRAESVSWKALLVGAASVALVSALVTYADLGVSIGWIGGAHLPAAAMGGFLLLVLVLNPLFRWVHRRAELRTSELVTVYCMTLFSALLSSFGLTAQLIPTLVGVNYFARPENGWTEMFYPHLKRWLVPFDPNVLKTQDVSRLFYEGLKSGQALPWLEWLMPLTLWTLFFYLMFLHLWFWAAILERQWIEHEKLTFPLVQLPLEIAQSPPWERKKSAFFRHRLVWVGAAIPVAVHTLSGLRAHFFPFLPEFRVFIDLQVWRLDPPWREMGWMFLFVSFSVMGFSYLVPSEMALSFWFFFLLSRAAAVIASAFGMPPKPMPLLPGYTFLNYQSSGASVVIALYTLWLMRKHLSDVWRETWKRASLISRQGEALSYQPSYQPPIPYRWVVWGGMLSLAGIILWCAAAGMRVWLAAFVMVSVVLFLMLVMTRCVCAGGLLMIQGTFRPTDLLTMLISLKQLGSKNLTVLSLLNMTFMRDLRGILLPTYLDSYKLAASVGLSKRSLNAAIVVTIILSTLLSYYIALTLAYHKSALTMSGWFMHSNPRLGWEEASGILRSPRKPQREHLVWFFLGIIVTGLLFAGRTYWAWFPLHPLGYAMWTSWSLVLYWFPFLIGWVIKLLILRYGGSKAYQRGRPFFLGLVLGEFAMAVVWAGVSAIRKRQGPLIPVS